MDNKNKKTKEKNTKSETVKVFKADAVLESFDSSFFDEAAVTDWVMKELHPEGVVCPSCKVSVGADKPSVIENFRSGKRVTCNSCSDQFTFRTGTFLQSSPLSVRDVFLIAFLYNIYSQDLTIQTVAYITNKTPDTIRAWFNKFEGIDTL